jgi:hypothetical protein
MKYQVGTTIDHYERVEYLGDGASVESYEAIHDNADGVAAVAVVIPQ